MIDGHELLAAEGCFPMVPWAGRIRDGRLTVDGVTHQLPLSSDGNAIHGLGRNAEWQLVGADTFRCVIGSPWPTQGVAELHYELLPDGLRITLTWQDGSDLPCSIGLHPWFKRRLDAGHDVVMRLEAEAMVERGVDGLPTGQLTDPTAGPWDDCFRIDGSLTLTWPSALTLTLASSAQWWVVFDERADTVCAEPQTAPPDAFDHPVLQPVGPWDRSVWFELRASRASTH